MLIDNNIRAGDITARMSIAESLANMLGLSKVSELRAGMFDLVEQARIGRLTDPQVRLLADASDMLERLEAYDRPWVFGNRYLSHRFVSTDPMCPSCRNAVPHRTMLACPTCNGLGPWLMVERTLQSSYIHYALVEQVTQLVNNSVLMDNGTHRADGTVTAMPRGGAKSTWLCEVVSEWLLLTRRSRCLLLLSNTINQVTERAIEIRDEISNNEKIIHDYGVQSATRQEGRVWTQDDFVLANMSRCVARGSMQSMRGVKNKESRPDVVISDDSDDEKFMTSPDQSRKLLDWWDTRVVPACHPNALYMVHGTVLGEMALLWQQLTGTRGVTSAKMIVKALQEGPGCQSCGMPADRVGPFQCPVCSKLTVAVSPHSFWGARFTVEALEAIKRRIGHWAWKAEFDQEPHDDSTSWFEKEWMDRAMKRGQDLHPVPIERRKVIPWSIIQCTLSGDEALDMAIQYDPSFEPRDGEPGPYQLILNTWDPAWARAKARDQKACWMAGAVLGLTMDDKLDIMWLDRARGLAGNKDYRHWMYESWKRFAMPQGVERNGQAGMIIERNGGGVLFQSDIEEYWGSIPMFDHITGTEKHSLQDGIPGMASWFKDDRVIIRCAGAPDDPEAKPGQPGQFSHQELAEELAHELKMSGTSQYTDMLMTIWFGWSFMNKWMRDVRDPKRFDELSRRNPHGRMSAQRR